MSARQRFMKANGACIPSLERSASFTLSGIATDEDSSLVRYAYRKGKVALSSSHPEALVGSNEDWMFWDNCANNSASSSKNTDLDPHNSWNVIRAIFNNWLTQGRMSEAGLNARVPLMVSRITAPQ